MRIAKIVIVAALLATAAACVLAATALAGKRDRTPPAPLTVEAAQ
jgi:hypothetical protein